jgi:transcriptional regulator with XRE-family HTH domain
LKRFGKILRQLRKERDLTQEELGALFNVEKNTVSGWESGRRAPSIETLAGLSQYFGVPSDFLLGLLDAKNIRLVTKSELLKFLPAEVVVKNKMSFLIDEPNLSEQGKKEIIDILVREGYFEQDKPTSKE